MNAQQILWATWIGTKTSERIIFICFFVALPLLVFALSFNPSSHMNSLNSSVFGPFYMIGALLFSVLSIAVTRTIAFVAIAHALQIPSLKSTAVSALIVFLLVFSLAPALLLAYWRVASPLALSIFLCTLVVSVFLIALLPVFFSYEFIYGAMALAFASHYGWFPGVRDSGFSEAGSGLLLLLLVILWVAVKKQKHDLDQPITWRTPSYIVYTRRSIENGTPSNAYSTSDLTRATLHLATPIDALRMWLGAPFKFTSIRSLVTRYTAAPLSAFVGVIIVILASPESKGLPWTMLGIGLTNAFLPFGRALTSEFCQNRNGMELMATLPGLGTSNDSKQKLLRAIGWPLLRFGFAQLLFSLAVIWFAQIYYFHQLGWLTREYLLTTLFLFAGCCVASLIQIVGALAGRQKPAWLVQVASVPFVIIASFVAFWGFSAIVDVIAVVYFGVLIAAVAASWREFRRRPHPFLISDIR